MNTPILGITEVAPNQSNKETTINDGFLALEQATNATLAVNLTSADATLVTLDFQHNQCFKCSGHTVARNLVVPNQTRFFSVWNNGTGIITVKTASPSSTVAVAAAAICVIYSDGSNHQKLIADSSVAAWGTPLFTGLTDAPGSYSGQAGKLVRVNAGETAVEFHQEIMANLGDVDSYTPLYFARVNAGGTGIEWVSSAGSTVSDFIAMTDAPGSYSGAGGKLLRVNSGATGVEFDAINAIMALTDITDCPSTLSAQADKVLAVKSDESGLHFVNLPSVGSVITLATGDTNAGFEGATLSPWSIDVGSGAGNYVTTGPVGTITPYAGSYFYAAVHTAETQEQISRVWDLTTLASASELDNNSYIQLGYAFAPHNASTTGLLTVQPMSATSVPIGSPISTGTLTGTLDTWLVNSLLCNLPTGTRKIKIVCQTNGTPDTAGCWDNLDFTLTVVQDAAFINLSDAPSAYVTGDALKNVRVKSTHDGLEFHAPKFLDGGDVPSSYTGQAHLVLRVNSGETALEFCTPSAPTLAALADVSVTEGIGIDGQALLWNNTASRWEASAVASALHALSDVSVTEGAPIDGYTLNWNQAAGKWEAVAPVSGGGSTLASDTDVNISSAADKQELRYDAATSKWINWHWGTSTKTSNYTLALGDADTTVELNSGSAINCTIPLNSAVAFPIGTTIELGQIGAGIATVVAATGVTINAQGGGLAFTAQHQYGRLRKLATDTWSLQLWGPGAGVTAFNGLSDVPSSYTSSGGFAVHVNAGATALEFKYSPAPTVQIAAYQAAVPTTSQLLARYIAAEKFIFPANFASPTSQARIGTAATGTPAFSVNQNGSQIGTISVSSTTATFATSSGTSKTISAGDYVDIVAPATADATIADICFTLIGTKSA